MNDAIPKVYSVQSRNDESIMLLADKSLVSCRSSVNSFIRGLEEQSTKLNMEHNVLLRYFCDVKSL